MDVLDPRLLALWEAELSVPVEVSSEPDAWDWSVSIHKDILSVFSVRLFSLDSPETLTCEVVVLGMADS